MFVCYWSKGQNNFAVTIGSSSSNPDLRTLNFIDRYGPGIQAFLKNPENHRNDTWYFFKIEKIFSLGKDTYLNLGLGHQRHITTFPDFINNIYFDNFNYRFYYVGKYRRSMFLVPIQISKKVYKNLSLGVGIDNNVIYKREISTAYTPNKNDFSFTSKNINFNNIDINPTINYELYNFNISLAARISQIKWRDEALAHSDKEIDTFNPLKFSIALGYNF
jgi:hypothetical protein